MPKQRVVRVADDEWYAVCDCGWVGPSRTTEMRATGDGVMHANLQRDHAD